MINIDSLDIEITATLGKAQVEKIIKAAVESQFDRKVKDITFTFAESSSYMDRGSYTTFTGAKVTFDTERPGGSSLGGKYTAGQR